MEGNIFVHDPNPSSQGILAAKCLTHPPQMLGAPLVSCFARKSSAELPPLVWARVTSDFFLEIKTVFNPPKLDVAGNLQGVLLGGFYFWIFSSPALARL